MFNWFSDPAPTWAQEAVAFVGSVWAPLLAGAGTWLSLRHGRTDEHARWRRDELITIGVEACELSQKKWDRLYYMREHFHADTQELKDINFRKWREIDDKLGYELADRLLFLAAKAKVFSAKNLGEAIEEVWRTNVSVPIADNTKEDFDAALTKLSGANNKLTEEAAKAVKIV